MAARAVVIGAAKLKPLHILGGLGRLQRRFGCGSPVERLQLSQGVDQLELPLRAIHQQQAL
jgi:hypothetical protein